MNKNPKKSARRGGQSGSPDNRAKAQGLYERGREWFRLKVPKQ